MESSKLLITVLVHDPPTQTKSTGPSQTISPTSISISVTTHTTIYLTHLVPLARALTHVHILSRSPSPSLNFIVICVLSTITPDLT